MPPLYLLARSFFMELACYCCEICASYKTKKEEVFLIKLVLEKENRRIEKTVDDWYTGIRILCKECAKNIAKFLPTESISNAL